MNKDSKSVYWKLSAFLFFYQLTWASGYSLYALWLGEEIKLNSVSIGMILSVNAVFAVLSKIFYGYLLDKFGLRKNVLWIISLFTLLLGPFFIYLYGPLLKHNLILGTIIGGFYLGFTYLAGIAAIESYIDKCGRTYDFEYGKTRMWGSLGWAVSIFFAGQLFNINPNINFWLASCSAVILIFILASFKTDGSIEKLEKVDPIKVKDILSLFKMKSFWIFVSFVVGVAWSYFIMEQQFSRYFVSMFSNPALGNKLYGYLGSAQVFIEGGMMFVAPSIINKIGPKRGLLLAGAIMVFRIIGSGLVIGPIGISLMKLLAGFELPILLVSVFKYIAANFNSRLSSSTYLIGYQSMLYVGLVTVGPVAGKLYDSIGFGHSYLIIGSIALVFTIISSFTLSNKWPKELDSSSNEDDRVAS